jgi:23S rRNA (guanine2445-N2)-methyltransferase / 23S rRNA (guanine2069-N7)-methyltransferase
MIFFATTAKNIEPLLLEELKSLGANEVKGTHLGVYFKANLETAYRVCLWSRLTHHLFLELKQFGAMNQENLYGAMRSVDWSKHLNVNQTFRIDVSGRHPTLTHPHFIAQVAKDAIVDQFRKNTGERPSIEPDQPDVVFHLHVKDEHFTLNLDLSGESLHRRGLRTETGLAPLKETLAAAILIRMGWPKMFKQKQAMLFDPCCGAGTLLLEGAMMAYDIAPSLLRNYFGFLGWKQHQAEVWQKLRDEAEARAIAGRKATAPLIMGFDLEASALLATEQNFKKLQLDSILILEKRQVADIDHLVLQQHQGLLVTNPPYGKRLMAGRDTEIEQLYSDLGTIIKAQLEGWKIGIFTSEPSAVKAIRMRPQKQYQFLNGALDCTLISFEARPEHYWRA